MDVLRFATAGSVDDGKSTLVGRLLLDLGAVFEDETAEAIEASRSGGIMDLSLLTDGLKAEREQGITIDVAYRYFSSSKRRFIVADTPGHEQYTRNMVTGSSRADCIVILVDITVGITIQTRRHMTLAKMLRIPHIVLAVNKMDLVGWDEDVFTTLRREALELLAALPSDSRTHVLPMSALHGDNVVVPSRSAAWYRGSTLLETLETIEVARGSARALRLPIQTVIRTGNERFYAGTVADGSLSKGDVVSVSPPGVRTTVSSIIHSGKYVERVRAGTAVAIQLLDDIDIGRGSLISSPHEPPAAVERASARMFWMTDEPLRLGRPYVLRTSTQSTQAWVVSASEMNMSTMKSSTKSTFEGNSVLEVQLDFATSVFVDNFSAFRTTGSFVLIDEFNFGTVAAGLFHAIIARCQNS